MADDSAPRKRRKKMATGAEKLRSEIKALSKRFEPGQGKQTELTWDTELLVKKTQTFDEQKIVSTKDPDWKEVAEQTEIGPKGICISDVRSVDAIEFIAAFAARRRLDMTYGNGSFLLEPRNLDKLNE